MAIEGPLRELGIHDVFQLLDLNRKTGVLRVTLDGDDDGTATAMSATNDDGDLIDIGLTGGPDVLTVEPLSLTSARLSPF